MSERRQYLETGGTYEVRRSAMPPPGPSSRMIRDDFGGSVGFWFFIVFCLVMLGLLFGAVVGWWHP